MPLVYRSMKQAVDGLPVVGENSKEFGVRVPPNPNADVDVDKDGNVELNGSGMSVARHWTLLRSHLVPQRLAAIRPGAVGKNYVACYRFGTGVFEAGTLNDDLEVCLKPGEDASGNIVPSRLMTVDEFQQALATTRRDWTVDEAPP